MRSLRAQTAHALVRARGERTFNSIRDLTRRVPELTQRDLVNLSELGALNGLPQQEQDRHRRGAVWQAALLLDP